MGEGRVRSRPDPGNAHVHVGFRNGSPGYHRNGRAWWLGHQEIPDMPRRTFSWGVTTLGRGFPVPRVGLDPRPALGINNNSQRFDPVLPANSYNISYICTYKVFSKSSPTTSSVHDPVMWQNQRWRRETMSNGQTYYLSYSSQDY